MVRSSELSSAKRQSVASEGLISKVAGSRCTSMSHAWWARISPVRWLLKYMSTLGTASTNWMRKVSALFWAKAGCATAALAAVSIAVRRESFTKSLLCWASLGCWPRMRQASRHNRRSSHGQQTDRQGAQRRTRHPEGMEGSSWPRCDPAQLQVRGLHPRLGIHDQGGIGGREGRPPSRMVERLQQGRDHAV